MNVKESQWLDPPSVGSLTHGAHGTSPDALTEQKSPPAGRLGLSSAGQWVAWDQAETAVSTGRSQGGGVATVITN